MVYSSKDSGLEIVSFLPWIDHNASRFKMASPFMNRLIVFYTSFSAIMAKFLGEISGSNSIDIRELISAKKQ